MKLQFHILIVREDESFQKKKKTACKNIWDALRDLVPI